MQITQAVESVGRLMSPEEVHAATKGRANMPDELRRQWYLCADVPDPFWDALAKGQGDLGFRLSAFTTPNQTAYAVFTVQQDTAQVRFLLPLGSRTINRFLRDASHAGVMLSLSKAEGSQALIKRFPVAPAGISPVFEIARTCQVLDYEDTLLELALAMLTACDPGTVPSTLHHLPVTRAYPVVILPEPMQDDMQNRSA